MTPVWWLATASMLMSQTINRKPWRFNKKRWKVLFRFLLSHPFKTDSPGIRTIAKASYVGRFGSSRMLDADQLKLQQLFSGHTERRENELESLREQYKCYKESYVKYMQFDPDSPDSTSSTSFYHSKQ